MTHNVRPDWAPRHFDLHWNAFCDSDHQDYPDNFIETCEADGLVELVAVTNEALQETFATERGIYPGGSMWVLTKAGHEACRLALAHRTSLDKIGGAA